MAPDDKKQVAKTADKPKKAFEATYTVEELVQAADEFKTSKVVVRAALTKAGKTSYTMREASLLVDKLKNKEVKA